MGGKSNTTARRRGLALGKSDRVNSRSPGNIEHLLDIPEVHPIGNGDRIVLAQLIEARHIPSDAFGRKRGQGLSRMRTYRPILLNRLDQMSPGLVLLRSSLDKIAHIARLALHQKRLRNRRVVIALVLFFQQVQDDAGIQQTLQSADRHLTMMG